MLARTGPFSSAKVIELINKNFAPVYITNQDYNKKGTAPAEEKAEFDRIRSETWSSARSPVNSTRFSPFVAASRDIALYILKPDGAVVDAMRLPEVGQTDRVHAFLETMIKQLDVTPGDTLVPPRTWSVPPKNVPADSLILHVTTRYTTADGKRCACPAEFDPTLLDKTMSNRIRAASQLPSEKWFVLGATEWADFVGPKDAELGSTWAVNPDLTTKLFRHFYPPSENNDLDRTRLEEHSLTGTLTKLDAGKIQVRLDGKMKLKHPFVRIIEDDLRAECGFVGYVDIDPQTRQIKCLRMVSVNGTYTQENFGVAMRSVP